MQSLVFIVTFLAVTTFAFGKDKGPTPVAPRYINNKPVREKPSFDKPQFEKRTMDKATFEKPTFERRSDIKDKRDKSKYDPTLIEQPKWAHPLLETRWVEEPEPEVVLAPIEKKSRVKRGWFRDIRKP